MVKKCSRCCRTLDTSYFNWKIKEIKLATYCKECSRAYIKDHYERNRQYYLNKARKRNLINKSLANEYIWEYLNVHPCIDCGETDPIVLEFDHRDHEEKIGAISGFMRDRGVLSKIKAEIVKCDVRCANCHRRKTANETRSWKLGFGKK